MNIFFSVILSVLFVFTSCAKAENSLLQTKKLEYIQGLADFIFDTMSLKSATKEEKVVKIRSMIENEMDFEWNAKMALGSHGRAMSEADFKKFVSLYKELLCQNWATKFAIAENASKKDLVFNERIIKLNTTDDAVSFYIETKNGNKIDLKIIVKTLDAATNKFKVVDLIGEGVSIAMSYRSQFSSYIDANGLESIIAHLEKTVKQNNHK